MITIVATWINHPEVLKAHRDLWVSAFPGHDVQYIAYIDAKNHGDFSNFNNASMKHQLVDVCVKNTIEFLIVPQELHEHRSQVFWHGCIDSDQGPSGRNALVCQYAWNKEVLKGKAERLVLVQSDIFPYRKFNWNDMMMGRDFYYKPQTRTNGNLRVDYAWEGLCLFDVSSWSADLKSLVDFECGMQKGVHTDTGGGLWKILEVLPEHKKVGWTGQNSLQWTSNDTCPELPYWIMEHLRTDPRNTVNSDGTITYYSEIQDNKCFHLRAGGNWDNAGKEIHDTRYSNFLKLLQDAIRDGTVFLD